MDRSDNHPELALASSWLRAARHVVVFTGAGISAASGIATFRDADGFWTRFPPEDFANWQGLLQTAILEPKRFAEFLLAVVEPIAIARPNAAHRALADLEKSRQVTIVTQNIDRLHQLAGSETVREVHGSLFDVVSFPEGKAIRTLTREELSDVVTQIRQAREDFWTSPKLLKAVQPLLGLDRQGLHRPKLVLFGDELNEPDWSEGLDAAANCDLLLSVGTSHSVMPAASLPGIARSAGARVICIDPAFGAGDLWINGAAEQILPQLMMRIDAEGEDHRD